MAESAMPVRLTQPIPGFTIPEHDFIALTQTALEDIWTFRLGGAGGTIVTVITVTFTDAGKGTISTVEKT